MNQTTTKKKTTTTKPAPVDHKASIAHNLLVLAGLTALENSVKRANAKVTDYRKLLKAYRQLRAVDGCNGRDRDADRYLAADRIVQKLESSLALK